MEHLLPFCTDKQRLYVEAVIKHGSQRKAAAALGVAKATVDDAVVRAKRNAARAGVAPNNDLNYPLAEGEALIGRSVYTTSPAGHKMWVKTSVTQEKQLSTMREVAEALKAELPRYDSVPCAGGTSHSELLNTYIITDYHLGMKAWHEEAGEDWDLEIAENLLVNWFSAAIAHAPMSEKAVFAQLGDFLHWDGYEAVTPQHKHVLDADTRFQKLVRVAIRVLRKVIGMLLTKHQTVYVIMADANHDPASGAWLREMFASVYEDEPRVIVDTSADAYYCHEHGLTALFFHHGHKRGVADLDKVFAGKYREVFGRTKYAYGHTGHLHSNETKESQLMTIERHRTLATSDAYAAKGGWLSGRDAKVITYHSDFGEVSRLTINPDMLKPST